MPVQKKKLLQSFHELSEYFVKTLDYEDVEGIFLAYELHKATLQEKYDLKTIMEEYEIHEEERKKRRDTGTGCTAGIRECIYAVR